VGGREKGEEGYEGKETDVERMSGQGDGKEIEREGGRREGAEQAMG